jgi:hypothetical protein
VMLRTLPFWRGSEDSSRPPWNGGQKCLCRRLAISAHGTR